MIYFMLSRLNIDGVTVNNSEATTPMGREGKSSDSSPSFAPEDSLDFLEAKVEKFLSETSGAQHP